MKLFYEIFILTSLIFYSTLSIVLLAPLMYRKVRSLMAAGRPASKRMARLQHHRA